MAVDVGDAFWLFLIAYMVMVFMSYWLIRDVNTRNECLKKLSSIFWTIIALWLAIAIALGGLIAIIAGSG